MEIADEAVVEGAEGAVVGVAAGSSLVVEAAGAGLAVMVAEAHR